MSYFSSALISNPRRVASIGNILTTGAAQTLFTIAGGRIRLLGLVARVTTALGATATTVNFNTNPTTGADTAISAASVDIQSAPIGAKLSITGVVGDATVFVTTGGAIKDMVTPLDIDIGTIELIIASGGDATGKLAVEIVYEPLTAGATLT